MLKKKRVAILSTPRSGTQLVTEALRELGVKVGHEKIDDDGTVCGFWAWADVTEGYMPCASHITKWQDPSIKFEHTFHLYRDPLKSLRTMPHVLRNKEVYGRWLSSLGLNGFEINIRTCLHYWVVTHERLLARDLPRINIETIEDQWDTIARPLGIGPLPPGIHKASLDFQSPKLGWRDLDSIDISLSNRAQMIWSTLSGLL